MEWVEIKRRLSTLDTVCLCNARKSIRVLDPAIRPLFPGRKLTGLAHTAMCQNDDNLTLIKALHDAQPGEVLVINAAGSTKAMAGELVFLEAGRKALAGIVINGGVHDTGRMRDQQMPIYSRFIFPLMGEAQSLSETQIPVTFGAIKIEPGDILFGDDDGIVVMTKQEAEEILPVAEKIQASKQKIVKQMAYDTSLFNLINFQEHCEKVAANQSSVLRVNGTQPNEASGF